MRKSAIAPLMMVSFLWASTAAGAPASKAIVNLLYNLQICKGRYAPCAASTCTLTGGPSR
jgi:hypothetical protein